MRVPIFPLNSVMFPGVSTPLHVFEDRYRALVRDLLAVPEPADRVFGIVAIREGYEVGEHSLHSSHRVGTLVQVTEHQALPDGRYDIEVVGRERIRVRELLTDGEYLRAEVDRIDDAEPASSPEAVLEADRARAAFAEYRERLAELRGGPVLEGDLPGDPAYLSYGLAATCLLTLGQRQALLESPDAATRLRQLRRLLRQEQRAMTAVPSLPATEIGRTRWSPN